MLIRPRREFWIFAGLVFVAMGLRAFVLVQGMANLAFDPDGYAALAKHLAAGQGFVDPENGLPTAFRPPLYPVVIAIVMTCGGGVWSIGLFHALLGTATVGLTWWTGIRLGLGRTAWLAAALVAVDPLLLHNTALVMTETLATFLSLLMCGLLSRWSQTISLAANLPPDYSPRSALDRPPSVMAAGVLAGVSVGLATLCRPAFLAVGLLAVLMSVVLARREERSWRGLGRGLSSFAIAFCLTLSPWIVRNAISMGAPLVTTTHGGYTLLLGHNPVYDREVVSQPWGTVWGGESLLAWQEALEVKLMRETPPLNRSQMTPAVEIARDRWMGRQARQHIADHPTWAVRECLSLCGRLWNIAPLTLAGRPLPAAVWWSIATFYSVCLVGMMAGILRLTRDDFRRWWPFVLVIAVTTLVHTVYWSDMRMRAPLIPAIALLAARSVTPKTTPRRGKAC